MTARFPSGKKWWVGGLALLVVIGFGAAGWVGRAPLFAWYAVYRLSRADEAGREVWVERVAGLEGDPVPRLVARLAGDDERASANARAALERFIGRWAAEDPRRARLGEQLADVFPRASAGGRRAAVDLTLALARGGDGRSIASAARLVAAAAPVTESGVRQRALALAALLGGTPDRPDVAEPCRALTRAALGDADPDNRVRAVRLAAQPAINQLGAVAPLLHDPIAEVRRAALLALGPATDVLTTDDLLVCLHDTEPGIRHLCESALRGRGLPDAHIRLGHFLTAGDAKTRLQVLDDLRESPELEPGVWIRRLSHDPAAAVRAAAVRAATEFPQVDLADRMGQIARDDPSPTVRQLAAYYLTARGKLTARR